ncbi:MAG: EAL domain-containing protein, partial [Bacillota bacterium]|nr:EAL domain-containing protein [Bacillota bacterium]
EKCGKLLTCLEQAIEEDRIVPFFQKIVNIKTGENGKYEVLMRIKSGDEFLSPYPFIVTAEKYNLIDKVDFIMLEKALSYKKRIDIEDKLIFSFNLSGKLLNNREYLNKAKAIIDKYNIKHENIIFEITETENIKNINKLANTIKKYNKENFKFSIDDFGTGYSSIYYLKNINVDYLKIDGSFIKDINEKEENLYLVKSIINMAKAFNTKIVAEFVENQYILKTLNDLGVDFAQGYYFNKPEENIII